MRIISCADLAVEVAANRRTSAFRSFFWRCFPIQL